MKIRLLAFASAGDILGTTEMELEIPRGARVIDLRARLERLYPATIPLWPRMAVAVNGQTLEAGDGAAVTDETSLEVTASTDAEVLVFDLA